VRLQQSAVDCDCRVAVTALRELVRRFIAGIILCGTVVAALQVLCGTVVAALQVLCGTVVAALQVLCGTVVAALQVLHIMQLKVNCLWKCVGLTSCHCSNDSACVSSVCQLRV
jgi:hypothetical protein